MVVVCRCHASHRPGGMVSHRQGNLSSKGVMVVCRYIDQVEWSVPFQVGSCRGNSGV